MQPVNASTMQAEMLAWWPPLHASYMHEGASRGGLDAKELAASITISQCALAAQWRSRLRVVDTGYAGYGTLAFRS